jgi:hypothetical protein
MGPGIDEIPASTFLRTAVLIRDSRGVFGPFGSGETVPDIFDSSPGRRSASVISSQPTAFARAGVRYPGDTIAATTQSQRLAFSEDDMHSLSSGTAGTLYPALKARVGLMLTFDRSRVTLAASATRLARSVALSRRRRGRMRLV